MDTQANTEILATHGLSVLDEGDNGVTVRAVPPQWYSALAHYYEQHDLAPLGLASGVLANRYGGVPRTQSLRFPAGTYHRVKELLQCWHVPHWL
jgi:hypothetical protein